MRKYGRLTAKGPSLVWELASAVCNGLIRIGLGLPLGPLHRRGYSSSSPAATRWWGGTGPFSRDPWGEGRGGPGTDRTTRRTMLQLGDAVEGTRSCIRPEPPRASPSSRVLRVKAPNLLTWLGPLCLWGRAGIARAEVWGGGARGQCVLGWPGAGTLTGGLRASHVPGGPRAGLGVCGGWGCRACGWGTPLVAPVRD